MKTNKVTNNNQAVSKKQGTHNSILDMAYSAVFSVILVICSWISIPAPVPFTLQTFGIFLSLVVLGGKRGTLSVFIYMLLGIIGIPVFSGFKGGIGCLFQSTGGYIIGFLISALLMWLMEVLLGKKDAVLISSMVLGLIVCYAFGTLFFVLVYLWNAKYIGFWTALTLCVFPYIIPDAIKLACAFTLGKRLRKIMKSI